MEAAHVTTMAGPRELEYLSQATGAIKEAI